MEGNPARHRGHRALEHQLRALRPPPRDGGMLRLVVARGPDGRHTPERARFTPDEGLEHDRWATGEQPKPDAQIAIMRADIAAVLGGGQDLALFGDNLLVDLDLHEDALPTGTRLRIGTVSFEVTAKAHTGCKKFRARFGLDALKIMSQDAWIAHRLRGVYLRVVEGGEAGPGDQIKVERRPG